jgi:PIN domain nuclease of toxin-antitoxin system
VKILLDTCTFLWLVSDNKALSKNARDIFRSADNDVFLSVVSAWEIAIKFSLGNLPLPADPMHWITASRQEHKITSLPLDEEAACYATKLPLMHKDPFDRMLICQAIVHELTLLTPDAHISQYPIRTLW